MIRWSLILLFFVAATSPRVPSAGDAAHHEAEVRLWPESGRLEAVERIVPGASRRVALTLAPGLTIEQATVDGRSIAAERDGDVWRTDAEIEAGKTLQLSYGGRLRTEPSTASPFLGSDGGFLPAGSGWLPTVAEAPATFDLTLVVPQPFKALATGRLVEESEADGLYRARFVTARAGEGPSAFVGPYVVAARPHGDIDVRTWFYEDEAELAGVYLEQAARYLRLFEQRIGAYPYDAFHVVAAPLPVGLGFPGLAYVSRRILRLPFMQSRSLAHEILHNWWGNAVRVAYAEGNWAEGLTTYMADYALAAMEGAEEAREMRLAWLRDFAALPPERDVALAGFTAKSHDADQVVGYNKAAFVFHMLRRRAGDAGFDAAIRRFWQRHRFETASWSNLRQSFEATIDDELSAFFGQWLARPGAPRLYLDEARARHVGPGFEVSLTLGQDEPAYTLLVPVEIETENGTERHHVELDRARANAVLSTDARPIAVAIDPDYDLFRHLAPGEAPPILRDVTLSPETLTLIAAREPASREAAEELAAALMDTEAKKALPRDPPLAGAPILLIGISAAVTDALSRAGLPDRPASLAGRGSARVWTARREAGAPVLVVEADDPAALRALLRPLPHYRQSSYVVFDGDRVVERGVWPTGDSPLRTRLDDRGE